MQNEKMREEFEVWFEKMRKGIQEKLPPYCMSGIVFSKEVMWEGWKASREELVIDLSGCKAELYDGGAYYDACKVDDVIEAQGLKVKS